MICRTVVEYDGLDSMGKAFDIGDVIAFDLLDGEHMEAMAVKEEADGVIFCAVDCFEKEYPLDESGAKRYSYDASTLRATLNEEVIKRFPDEIRSRMIPFENGDLLRIPTEKEIFGENKYGVKELENVTQWEPMKLRRNRIALCGHNGVTAWYWLQNGLRDVSSATGACVVGRYGCANGRLASSVFAVRPAFKIENL